MSSQPIVDYIQKHTKAGTTEAAIRNHMLARGWSQTATDNAFVQYRRALELVANKPLKRAGRRRHGRSRWFKLAVASGVVIAASAVYLLFLYHPAPKTVAVEYTKFTYPQRQVLDVNIVAGVIAQYAVASGGVVPTKTVIAPGGNLLLCATDCDPSTSLVSPLSTYAVDGVQFHPYAAGLTAPDIKTMYLVPGASCANASSIGEPNPKPRSMVILYAKQTAGVPLQRCVTL